jgi:hypothetical protein
MMLSYPQSILSYLMTAVTISSFVQYHPARTIFFMRVSITVPEHRVFKLCKDAQVWNASAEVKFIVPGPPKHKLNREALFKPYSNAP